MTPTHPQLARAARLVVMQKAVKQMHVSDVQWAGLQPPLEAQAKQRVSPVNLGSSLALGHRPVASAHLVELTMTPIRPLSVRTAWLALSPAVARQPVPSAWQVRSTATITRPRHVQHAWLVSTGRLRQQTISAGALNVRLARLTWTLTAPQRVLTVSSESMLPLGAPLVRSALLGRSITIWTPALPALHALQGWSGLRGLEGP
jgi:hypothetical protein